MAFIKFYNTRSYEVASLGSAMGVSIPLGSAVKIDTLPSGLSTPGSYFKVSKAGTADNIFGVVSAFEGIVISDTTPGRVILMNSGIFPVLLSASVNKDDFIKVQTANGEWAPIGMGEIADAQAIESGTMGNLIWARPIKFKP